MAWKRTHEEYAQRVGEKQVNWFDFRLVEILTCYVLYFNCFCHYLCPYSVKFSPSLTLPEVKKTNFPVVVLAERPRARSPVAIENVAFVAGAKRGGGGGGGGGSRKGKGKGKEPSLSPQSPSPFSLLPYPLPLSTPATQAIENGNRTYRCRSMPGNLL